MLKWLREAISRAPTPRPDFEHPALGRGIWDEDSEAWSFQILADGEVLTITVAGEDEPDPSLLERAKALAADLVELKARVEAVKSEFCRRSDALVPSQVAEIEGLRIASVHFQWPERPSEALISFHEVESLRAWRMQFVDGQLVDLNFDD